MYEQTDGGRKLVSCYEGLFPREFCSSVSQIWLLPVPLPQEPGDELCHSKTLLKFLCFPVFLRGKTLPPPCKLWALPRLSSLFGGSLAPGTKSAQTLNDTGSSSLAPPPTSLQAI